ncbi:transcriptional regulator FeaR [Halomonas sp. KAO]|uniref:transcriptional regulator FeaR n=1 Tax=Halomonas sp. KAO TaxID=2783858 RepID=UPI00189E427B|nr:transcriptional regulator FeaR [Halomonas sp. KAO]MBF7053821.1 transcriptional regulator FeaR [Halomonas sp. KAO]
MRPSPASQPTFATWLSSLRRVCGSFDSQPPRHNTPFQGRVGTLTTGGLEIAEVSTNARRIARLRDRAGGEDDRYCFLIVQRQGHAEVRSRERSLTLRPGEMMLADSAREFEILPQGLIEQASFHLPRQHVAERVPQGIPFGKLLVHGLSGQLLQLMVNRIVSRQLVGEADRLEGEALGEALVALLLPLASDIKQSPMPLEGTEVLYQGARQLIDQQLQDPELTPAVIAQRLAVSVRQLYRLFEAHEDTVCRYIQRRRLDCCAEDLANPAQLDISITEIAFRWGFTDSAHFSRAFKKAHGISPRDYRRHHSLH